MKLKRNCLGLLIASGLAATCGAQSFLLDDQLNVTEPWGSETQIVALGTDQGFTGIDDTYTGTMTVTWTAEVSAGSGDIGVSAAGGLELVANVATTPDRRIEIGEFWNAPRWGFWKGPNGYTSLQTDDLGTIVEFSESTMEDLVLTIDFVAGMDDTGSILFRGYENPIVAGDYSFDEIRLGAYNLPTNFTNMSVEFTTAVPEPSAFALLLGIIGLAAVGIRRSRR